MNADSATAGLRWVERPWTDLDFTHAAEGREVGLVPVGATEQHGPHLPAGTDTIIAEGLCARASHICGAPVLPAITVAVSFGHGLALPGTISHDPETVARIVRDYAEWAPRSGLKRLLFVNAHFGNTGALDIATDHLRIHRPDIRVGIVNWWSVDPWVTGMMTADGADVHANCAETSVMLALAPHLVRLNRLPDADDEDRTDRLVFRYTAESLSRNGVTGRPSEATTQLGEDIVERVVNALVASVELGRVEEPPLHHHSTPSTPTTF